MKKKIIGLAFTIAVVSALSTAAYASTYVNNEDVTKQCIYVKFKRIYIVSGKIFG